MSVIKIFEGKSKTLLDLCTQLACNKVAIKLDKFESKTRIHEDKHEYDQYKSSQESSKHISSTPNQKKNPIQSCACQSHERRGALKFTASMKLKMPQGMKNLGKSIGIGKQKIFVVQQICLQEISCRKLTNVGKKKNIEYLKIRLQILVLGKQLVHQNP